MADILILTGPPGAGKSTVAQALAERYDRVAHIEVDVLRHFITPTGFAKPGQPERAHQASLGIRNACSLACNFIAERFAVIIDDVVIDKEDLDLYLEGLQAAAVPVHFVRLMPRLEVCQKRNRGRNDGRMPAERVETVHREFVTCGEFAGVTIDSSEMNAYETADRLQALTTSGASIVWKPASAGEAP